MSEQPPETVEHRLAGQHEDLIPDAGIQAIIERQDALMGTNYASDDDEGPTKHTSEETLPASSEAGEQEPTDAEPDADRADALAALKRAGLSEKALGSMSKDDLIAMAESQKKLRAERDDFQRQMAELKKGQDGQKTSAEDSDELGAPVTEEPPSPDANPLRAGIEALSQELGPEAAKAIEALVTPLVTELQQTKQTLGALVADRSTEQANSVFDELGDSYPQLQRAEAREIVEGHAAQLVQSGKAPDARTAVRQATIALYGETAAPTDPNQQAREQGVASMGDYSGGGGVQSREMTHEDKADAALWALVNAEDA